MIKIVSFEHFSVIDGWNCCDSSKKTSKMSKMKLSLPLKKRFSTRLSDENYQVISFGNFIIDIISSTLISSQKSLFLCVIKIEKKSEIHNKNAITQFFSFSFLIQPRLIVTFSLFLALATTKSALIPIDFKCAIISVSVSLSCSYPAKYITEIITKTFIKNVYRSLCLSPQARVHCWKTFLETFRFNFFMFFGPFDYLMRLRHFRLRFSPTDRPEKLEI